MITDIPFKTIETFCNQLIQLDPQTQQALTKLEGKRVRIVLPDWWLEFDMHFQNNQVQITQPEKLPDATIRTQIQPLMRFLTHRNQDLTALKGVHVEGDVLLVRQMAKLFQAMDIDWEEQLARFSGDILAHQVGEGVRKFRHASRSTWQGLKQNLTDYLQEELSYFPTAEELEDFYTEVGQVRNEVDRLEAKLNYLIYQQY